MKAFKKLSAFLLFVLLALSLFVCVSADNISDGEYDLSVAGAYEFASEFLIEYSRARDLNEPYDFSKYISLPMLNSYVSGRIEDYKYMKTLFHPSPLTNYSVRTELISADILGNCIRLKIGIHATFRYPNLTFDSGYGEGFHIIIAGVSGDYEIRDVHAEFEPYYSSYRGDGLLIDNPDFWVNANEAELSAWRQELRASAAASAAEQAAIQTEADAKVAAGEETATSSIPAPISTNATLYSLDKSAIVTWARANFNRQNPVTGNSNFVPVYFDFSTLVGSNFDCTNFASHALLAGGAVFNQVGTTGGTSWYYLGIASNLRSSSWSGVDQFYSFLTNNTTRGPAGQYVAYAEVPPSFRGFQLGDILQLKRNTDTSWSHTTIITAFNLNEALVTGRSSSSKYNNNASVASLLSEYSNGTRVIHLTGNYQ